MKKILALLLMVVMCFSCVSVYAEDLERGTVSGENAELKAGDPELTNNANSWRYSNGKPIEQDNTRESVDGLPVLKGGPNFLGTGVDVSSWQKEIDWAKVKAAGIDFAIIRCGYGENYTKQDDNTFLRNATECERLGIPYGVYLYSYATNTARASSEADHVLRLLAGRKLSYPVFYDMEDKSTLDSDLAGIATTFCNKITEAGYPVGVYANLNWWNNYLTDSCFSQWYRWVAQYYTTCQYKGEYVMWQYSSSGSVNGIPGRVDMNYLVKSLDGFTTSEPFTLLNENANNLYGTANVVRAAGKNRYETSENAADDMKKALGTEKFDNVVVASGTDYPDALAGSYLAKEKNAPMLLVDNRTMASKKAYIKDNLKPGGTIYILGGTGVVSGSFETGMSGFEIKRLGGANRYETNLKILSEVGKSDSDIIVCSGLTYADALSVSSAGKPVLIVDKEINSSQADYLSKSKYSRIYIVGGTGAVSSTVENECKKYGATARIEGKNRQETSYNVAKTFFGTEAESIAMVYSYDFPDGLSAGPLATVLDAPVLLVDTRSYGVAQKYVRECGRMKAVVLGGYTLIPGGTVNAILNR